MNFTAAIIHKPDNLKPSETSLSNAAVVVLRGEPPGVALHRSLDERDLAHRSVAAGEAAARARPVAFHALDGHRDEHQALLRGSGGGSRVNEVRAGKAKEEEGERGVLGATWKEAGGFCLRAGSAKSGAKKEPLGGERAPLPPVAPRSGVPSRGGPAAGVGLGHSGRAPIPNASASKPPGTWLPAPLAGGSIVGTRSYAAAEPLAEAKDAGDASAPERKAGEAPFDVEGEACPGQLALPGGQMSSFT